MKMCIGFESQIDYRMVYKECLWYRFGNRRWGSP